ncbi:gluconate:H+ symporter [Sphingomonas sp. CFBP 13720]|uniref:gluconate:H+ symporter n=1 Tax=Sphingomonas sp. CFBP 13720 TaxID=2775302 RepID=UPI0017834F7F|nr:gluconate:H+ symporter [Sphingomonas sp. CFBP 13720]MBD8678729.1 gluconate transporter [Sphingomonas sp. CFBP 13720]
MTTIAILAAVSLLILAISVGRVHPFLAFIAASILAALLLGLPLASIIPTIEAGISAMLGPIAIILVVGAMFGKLVADSGAARTIADTLFGWSGPRFISVAMAATGFLVGIPLFYNVGFVLLVPLIFSIANRAQMPVVYLGIPMLAGLSIAHGFLPPHPSPTALVAQFGADIGRTLTFGLLVGIPTLAIAGPVFALTTRGVVARPPALFTPVDDTDATPLPGAWRSFSCALLPVALLTLATIVQSGTAGSPAAAAVAMLGSPALVMLFALIVATVLLATARGRTLAQVGVGQVQAVTEIGGILLIIAGAGALKQVFVAGGADVALAAQLNSVPLPPLLLGWLLAMTIRVALGSATVAGLTAAGIMQPMVATHQADGSLMVLAIGAGSLMFSHVNDSGFWMFKEYFGLTVKQTFRTWSLMETVVGLCGLGFTLLLSLVI